MKFFALLVSIAAIHIISGKQWPWLNRSGDLQKNVANVDQSAIANARSVSINA
jgi:hypothetical protein